MLPLIVAATIAASPQSLVDASREAIGIAVGTRCPKAQEGEVVICGREAQRAQERQRLPLPIEPEKGDPRHEAVFAERNRWLDLGKSGIGSESTVGPGGNTGHNLNELKKRMDRNEGHPIRF